MTVFFRLMSAEDKQNALEKSIDALSSSNAGSYSFEVDPNEFSDIPGSPFSYWVGSSVRRLFTDLPLLSSGDYVACVTNPAGDDRRYFRLAWEVFKKELNSDLQWVPFSKGGAYSPFYYDIHLYLIWNKKRNTYHGFLGTEHRPLEKPASIDKFFRPGLTWPRRTNGLSFRALPSGCIFADKGPAIFHKFDDSSKLLALNAIVNSKAFGYLVSVQLARTELAQSFEVGIVQKTPVPSLDITNEKILAELSQEAWSAKRTLDSVNEISHAFLLPEFLRDRLSEFNPQAIADRINDIQDEIDYRCFGLYGFAKGDQVAATELAGTQKSAVVSVYEDDEEAQASAIATTDGLLSWAVGVAFGRFDWRLATGERSVPEEPKPFDALPEKSLGMLQSGEARFHEFKGVLLDEQGQNDDLPTLVESVLKTVKVELSIDVRRWLEKEFFSLHLKMYSKSRRQAPVYWPLQTPSGSYTLWVYYHRLNEQTLYTCVNDFIEGPSGKLTQVDRDLNGLRSKSARSSQEEKDLEKLTDLASELRDFRDELLRLAKFWRPNLNDGVQITAAPLWKLFQHKAWQKKLKETWESLEKGDYDWAHLACSIWPERVLRKCHQDRSLAIAHDVEEHFWHEVEVPVKRGKKTTGETKLEWQPKDLNDAELSALVKQLAAEVK